MSRYPLKEVCTLGKIMALKAQSRKQLELEFNAPLDEYTRQTCVVVLTGSRAIHTGLVGYLPGWRVLVHDEATAFGVLVQRWRPKVVVIDRDTVVESRPHERILAPLKELGILPYVIAIERPGRRTSCQQLCRSFHRPPEGEHDVPGLATLIQQAAKPPS